MENDRPPIGSALTAANMLTYSRLVLLPVLIIGVVSAHGWLTVLTMAAVWITDLLDGRMARRAGQASESGKTLDSTVDFVLIYGMFITFYAAGRIGAPQFLVIYVAMISILTWQLATAIRGGEQAVVSTSFGKLTGALQYTYMIVLVLMEVIPHTGVVSFIHWVVFALLALSTMLNTLDIVTRVRKLL